MFVQVSMAFENLAKNAGLQSYSTNDYILSVLKLALYPFLIPVYVFSKSHRESHGWP